MTFRATERIYHPRAIWQLMENILVVHSCKKDYWGTMGRGLGVVKDLTMHKRVLSNKESGLETDFISLYF